MLRYVSLNEIYAVFDLKEFFLDSAVRIGICSIQPITDFTLQLEWNCSCEEIMFENSTHLK